MKKWCFPILRLLMYATFMVIVTVSAGVLQPPPAGATTRFGGAPSVMSEWDGGTSLIKVRIHCKGKALNRVKLAVTIAGWWVAELKANASGAPITVGFTASASAGVNGGAGCPAGMGTGVLLSIVVCISVMVSGSPVEVRLKSVARMTFRP